MNYLIYKITNKVNGKIYIGKHKTEDENDDYFGSSSLLKRAMKKHGKQNFVKEIIHRLASEDEMNKTEASIVNKDFVLREDTYNLVVGGEGSWEYVNKNRLNGSSAKSKKWVDSTKSNWKPMKNKFLDMIHNDAAFKKRFSESIKARYARDGHPWDGRKHSTESKLKMASHDRSGNKSPSFGRMWINNGIENKKIPSDQSMPDGFVRGRLLGTVVVNNGIEKKYIKKDVPLPSGFVYGNLYKRKNRLCS